MSSEPFARLRRFLREFKRRNVYKVAATYAVVAFVAIQAADLLVPQTTLPGYADNLLIYLAVFGFPIALVLAWAFEVTPEGVRRTPDAEPIGEAATEDGPGLSTGYKVLVGLGVVAAAVAGGWYLTGGGGESPEVTEGTVAVLPFEVSGSGTEEWRDGMVSLLSTGLDGAAGLRAIADRTVFAAWEQRGSSEREASAEEALSVARQVGAQYALVGSAASLGSELQLAANVHAVESGERLGKVEVEGSPDSVTTLADKLTRRVIRVLAEETGEGLRSADLAAVTTHSVDALKAYLEGLQHRRAAETGAAVEDYRAAIRADSQFALPYARIGFLSLFHGPGRGQYIRQAYELSDQLPERERRLVRALYMGRVERRTLDAADSLRQLSRDYPDDPSVWETLGEFVFHEWLPRGRPEVEEIHQRAVALDPGYVAYYDHYVPPAFYLHHDSALAADRIEAVPQSQQKRLYRLGLELVFGDPQQRQRAFSRLDTISVPETGFPYALYLAPQDLDLLDTVLRRLLEREDLSDDPYGTLLFVFDLLRGQVQQALTDLQRVEVSVGLTAGLLAQMMTLDVPVPDSIARRYLAPENLSVDPSVDRLRSSGLYLLEEGRPEELGGLIRRIRARADTAGTDDASPGQVTAVVAELRGYRALRAGEFERATRLLDRSNESFAEGALWRGDVLRKLGRLHEAEGWYLAGWIHPLAQERLGQLYEEMNKPEKAAAVYRRFIAAWKDADPELQDRVEAARERLKKLTASGAEAND